MEKQALYFPYIRVPDNAWFTRVLLYWDSVGTILPSAVLEEKSRLGAYTAELIDAGLVKPIEPDYHLNKLPDFESTFFSLIDGDETIRRRRRLALAQGDVKRIHVGKMGLSTCEGLEERELGRPAGGPEWESWWEVESRSAEVFMSYLAATLAALPELRMDPVTDDASLFVPAADSPVSRAEGLRLSLLEGVLPAPAGSVSVAELSRFKEQHCAGLAAFRTEIEEELLRIALIPDEKSRQRQKALTQDRLRRDVEGLATSMRKQRWPKILFGTVCGLASVGTGAAVALGTGGVAVALAAPGVISGVYAAVQGFPRRTVPNSPLAYAALAHDTFVT